MKCHPVASFRSAPLRSDSLHFATATLFIQLPRFTQCFLYCPKRKTYGPLLVNTTMTERQEIYFELFDAGDIVRLDPIEVVKYHSNIDWEKNCVKTKVTVKGGKFAGQYLGAFLTVDFERFRQELSRLCNDLKGTANFSDLKGYLKLKIVGDGIGHFDVNVKACDQPGVNASELTFSMGFDQTELNDLINQLNKITKRFPVTGDFKLEDE